MAHKVFEKNDDDVMVAIEESKDLKVLTMDELFGWLYIHKHNAIRYNNPFLESAFPGKYGDYWRTKMGSQPTEVVVNVEKDSFVLEE